MYRSNRRENKTENDGTSRDGLQTVVTANSNNNNGNVVEHMLRVFENSVLRKIESMKDGQGT